MRVCLCVCVCVCDVYVCAHESILSRSRYSVQVAPKVSTSHYTMAVIMYMRVSEEGGKGGVGRDRWEGSGGGGKGRGGRGGEGKE